MPTLGHRRLLFLFVLLLALMAALARMVWVAIGEAAQDASRIAHTHRVQENLQEINYGLWRAIANHRGYLLTGLDVFLAEYHRAAPALQAPLTELHRLVSDHPEQLARVDRLRTLLSTRIEKLDESLAIYQSQGLSAVLAQVSVEDRRALEDEINETTEAIRQTEDELLIERQRHSQDSNRRSLIVASAAIGASTGILLLAFLLVVREQQRRNAAEQEIRRGNAQLQDSLEEMALLTHDLRGLSTFGEHLQGCRTQEEVIAAICAAGKDLLPGAAGHIYLINASHNLVERIGHWGTPVLASEPLFGPEACWCLRRGRLHAVELPAGGQVCAHVRAGDADGGSAAYMCLPLTAQGENLGLLHLSQPRRFDRREQQLAQALAERLSLALANLKLQETLRTQSIRDPLTGLFNRRYLEASFARELNRSERRGLPLAVMMLDLDHFKQFNDQHGHDAGDRLLAGFGQLLARLSRREDIACRYGGEEFTVILAETGAEQALERAEELRLALQTMPLSHHRKPVEAVTVSIGIAVYPEHGDTPEQLLSRADAALYAAKHAGRDRAVLAAA